MIENNKVVGGGAWLFDKLINSCESRTNEIYMTKSSKVSILKKLKRKIRELDCKKLA